MRCFTLVTVFCLLSIVAVSTGFAAGPYLTCAKDVNATAYDVWLDSATVATNVVPTQGWSWNGKLYHSSPPPGATEVHVLLDCASVTIVDGAHRFEVGAKNQWGVSAKSPLDFSKSLPGAPQAVTLLGE